MKKLATSTQRLGAVALIALVVTLSFGAAGCSGTSIAKDIVNWTPSLDSAAQTIAAIDPVLLPEAAGFVAVTQLVDSAAQAYLKNPSASALAQLQAQITNAQQKVNAALLSAAGIGSKTVQQQVLAALNTYGTIANTLLALVSSISSKTAVAVMATRSTVKLAQVLPYLDRRQAAALIAAHYQEPLPAAYAQIDSTLRGETAAGF
jgi:hypothetical protein